MLILFDNPGGEHKSVGQRLGQAENKNGYKDKTTPTRRSSRSHCTVTASAPVADLRRRSLKLNSSWSPRSPLVWLQAEMYMRSSPLQYKLGARQSWICILIPSPTPLATSSTSWPSVVHAHQVLSCPCNRTVIVLLKTPVTQTMGSKTS